MASHIMHDGEFNHAISNMVDDHIAAEGVHHHVNNEHGMLFLYWLLLCILNGGEMIKR